MKAIMVMFDSLNRHFLPSYGCDWTHAPNFARLSRRCATFDNSYICSMPCMPARRDLHTARPNFLHRSWGPLEPFDDSVPQMLSDAGVYTHLATDHLHYWEDGGATYHNRYDSYDLIRGQEGDRFIGQVKPVEPVNLVGRNAGSGRLEGHDRINRTFMRHESDQPQAKTFKAGLEFLRRNAPQDSWFLQLETFDPHEPFFTQRKFKDLYPHAYNGPHFDWPFYRGVTETPAQVEHLRLQYAALLSMCDAYLGDVLDTMDELNLWDDTLLMVWTDHGFLLGEHDLWAKCWQPLFYQEIAHTPFWMHDPRCATPGQRRQALVQPSLDLGPTLLNYFGVEKTPDMRGHTLNGVIENDEAVREAALFGMHGGHVNVTDGHHLYLRAPVDTNTPLNEYTLMPTHMNRPFRPKELQTLELAAPFEFTKGCQTLKIPLGEPSIGKGRGPTLLFDVQADHAQQQPLQNPEIEARMIGHLNALMHEYDAPPEQWQRLGLTDSGKGAA